MGGSGVGEISVGEYSGQRSKAQMKRDFVKTLPLEAQVRVISRQKAQRKKKRKTKPPAGMTEGGEGWGSPDPERWLPKRERSTYKKTRKEKAKEKSVVKGSQGAGRVDARLDRSNAPVTTNAPNLPKRSGPGRRKGRR